MKIDKKKIVFASIVIIVLVFIVSYTFLVFMEEEVPEGLKDPLVPELQEEQEGYSSKLKALDELKEDRERSIPSVYSTEILDSLDAYAPAIEEEPEWQIDSAYALGFGKVVFEEEPVDGSLDEEETVPISLLQGSTPEDLSNGHTVFFLSGLSSNRTAVEQTIPSFRVRVNGTQTVRTGDRLELILEEAVMVGHKVFPRNTLIYGFVQVKKNRLHIAITHLGPEPISLEAFDLQDGNEGIYIENSFRSEAGREVLDDIVQDINLTGLPQVRGIKNIFRKNNNAIKVTVFDHYELIIKPAL